MTEQTPKRRHGCFFYGCITSLVLLVLMLGALLLGLHYVKKLVNRFTDTQPMVLPTVQMSQPEIERVRERFEAFRQAVRDQRAVKPLALTADDINALIATGTGQLPLKGRFYVRVEGNQLRSEISLPLEDIGLRMFTGRYLNGSATFNIALHNGTPFVTAQTITVKGQSLPEAYMRSIRKENLAAGLVNDPEAVALLQRLQSVQVQDGTLVIEPKAPQ
jgi:hypothetical protein